MTAHGFPPPSSGLSLRSPTRREATPPDTHLSAGILRFCTPGPPPTPSLEMGVALCWTLPRIGVHREGEDPDARPPAGVSPTPAAGRQSEDAAACRALTPPVATPASPVRTHLSPAPAVAHCTFPNQTGSRASRLWGYTLCPLASTLCVMESCQAWIPHVATTGLWCPTPAQSPLWHPVALRINSGTADSVCCPPAPSPLGHTPFLILGYAKLLLPQGLCTCHSSACDRLTPALVSAQRSPALSP